MCSFEEFFDRFRSYDHPVEANKQHFDFAFNTFENKSSRVPKHSIHLYSPVE